MNATAIAFDFNGTLSNDEPVLLAVYQELFAELGHPLSEAEYYEHLAGHTDEEMFSRWLGHADPALIADRVERYIARVSDGSTVDDEARAAVRFAAARVPVAIVSAAIRSEIDAVVAAAGILDAITLIVAQDDVRRASHTPSATSRLRACSASRPPTCSSSRTPTSAWPQRRQPAPASSG